LLHREYVGAIIQAADIGPRGPIQSSPHSSARTELVHYIVTLLLHSEEGTVTRVPARQILQLGNPVLFERSVPVDDFGSTEIQGIVGDLSDTLAAFRDGTGYGRGIAGPQIGILKRVIFIRMQPSGFSNPLLNPEVVWTSDERIELWDDCFSFPDLLVRVSRAAEVRVDYQDERGIKQTIEAKGDLSELLQHEIDHLDGILAVQRAISPQSFATRTEWESRLRL